MDHYRLNNEIREQILRALLKKYDEEQGPAGKREDHALGQVVWRRLLGVRGLRLLTGLPRGWLPTTTAIYVAVGDRRYVAELPEPLPVPWSAHTARNHMTLRATDPLAQRLVRHEQQRIARNEARSHLRQQIWGTLRKAYTTRQLMAAWPEVEPFLPATTWRPAVAAAAPSTINKTLGLRPKKK